MSKLDLLLNDIEENCDPAEYEQSTLVCMIDSVSIIEYRLPPTAKAALQTCRDYRSGECSLQDLRGAIVDCWTGLGGGGRESRIDLPEVSAVRAVLCILNKLEGVDQHDSVDLMRFFLQLINNVEAHEDEQEALIRKYFARCLADS